MARAANPRRKKTVAATAPTTPDPIEMAMEAEAGDASSDSPARRVLQGQAALIQADLKLRGWEILERRAGVALKGLTILAGLALAAFVGFALWDASQARGLVVEAFSTPPDLAAKGLTGEVAAAQVIDRLRSFQDSTVSVRPAETYQSDRAADLNVEIPQTGVSIEAVQRLLRRWLGHQTRVSGELYRDGPALKLTVRMEGAAAATVTGSDAALDTLFDDGALALMASGQPYRYAGWLVQQDRRAEGIALLRRLASAGPRLERGWAHIQLVSATLSLSERRQALAEARRIAPEIPQVWRNVSIQAVTAGQFEAARAADREMARRVRSWPSPKGREADSRAIWTTMLGLTPVELSGDYGLALNNWAAAEFDVTNLSLRSQSLTRRARLLALLHRPGEAEALLPQGLNEAAIIVQGSPGPPYAMPRMSIAQARGDWPAVAREVPGLEALAAQVVASTPAQADAVALTVKVQVDTPMAQALAHMGRLPEAEARIAGTPLDCYPCLIVRGEVAEAAGDRARADRWFAEAARQGPSLAFAELAWGQAKLARADAAGALVLAQAASRKAPRFADPLETWGEALLAKGDAKAAAQKFAQGAKLAPRWGRLHLKWGEALAKLGKAEEARAKWRAAATMDLSAADRAALKAHGV